MYTCKKHHLIDYFRHKSFFYLHTQKRVIQRVLSLHITRFVYLHFIQLYLHRQQIFLQLDNTL